MATVTSGPRKWVIPDHRDLPESEGEAATPGATKWRLPDHLDLPEEDGTFVKNLREHPQGMLLTDSILPRLRAVHPDGQFAIGQDAGIYWRIIEPPLQGVKAPDWFYVPGVPPDLDGHYRRSYVLWQELIPPRVILEFSSGNGSEERDNTPWTGKFWVYEQIIRPAYYGIFDVESGGLQVFAHVAGSFQPLTANDAGRFPFPELGVELGVWRGYYVNEDAPWMRWWDANGQVLPTYEERFAIASERIDEEHRRADEERRRADEAVSRAEALAAKLRALGIDPDQA